MNNLEIFKNEEFGEIRTIELENGKIMFCGSDVARALGYVRPSKAIIDHCKGILKWDTPTSSGIQSMSYITEGDLYRLIASSKLESAQRFESWIFDEILPSIRKHGKYEMPKNPFETLKLMFDVVEDHEQKIDNMSKDIIDIKENAPLNPGEYNYIGGLVTSKVRKIVEEELGLKYHENRDVKKELFKSINGEIKKITGIDTRSQLKQKDFKMVKDFVQNWEPSKATLIVIQQLNLN